jgi:hypothetical protein
LDVPSKHRRRHLLVDRSGDPVGNRTLQLEDREQHHGETTSDDWENHQSHQQLDKGEAAVNGFATIGPSTQSTPSPAN